MAYTTIDKHTLHFNNKNFSGNGSATIHTISAWIKKSSDMNTTTPEKIFFAGSGSNQHQLYLD